MCRYSVDTEGLMFPYLSSLTCPAGSSECWEGNKKNTLVRRPYTCGSLALKLDVCDRTWAHVGS